MPGSLTVFSGMDGAGKSTQIERLVTHLSSTEKPPVVLWSRGGYTPGMLLLKRLLRRSAGSRMPASGPSEARSKAFQSKRTRKWWLRLSILDLMLYYGVWIRWLRLTGRSVICDRYLDDTRLDFDLNFPQENVGKWRLWKILAAFTPRPDHRFLLLIPVEESQRRSKLKNEPFPDSAEVLQTRLADYSRWAEAGNWHALDGTRPLEELSHEICQTVVPDQPSSNVANSDVAD